MTGDTILAVADASGAFLDFNDDENFSAGLVNSRIDNFSPPADDDYYVLIFGFGVSTPEYQVVIEP